MSFPERCLKCGDNMSATLCPRCYIEEGDDMIDIDKLAAESGVQNVTITKRDGQWQATAVYRRPKVKGESALYKLAAKEDTLSEALARVVRKHEVPIG